MASILSYNQIIELLTDISKRHYQLNTFYLGRNWELENSEDITYPLFQVYPDFGKLTNNGYSEYKTQDVRFVCKVIDKTFNGEENEKDVHSDTLRIAQDIVNEFSQHPFYIRSNIKLIGDVDFRPLEEFEDDITAGWEFSLTFRIINLNTFCGMPIEQIPGYSATGPTSDGVIVNVKFLTCETLPDCSTIQDIQGNITTLFGDTSSLFDSVNTINTDITNISQEIIDLQYQIDNLPPSGLTCDTIGDCSTIINIQSNIDDINTQLDNLPAQKWIDGSTGYQSIKANNDSGLDATGDYSVAEGAGTLSSGFASHSEGSSTIASGLASHAEGNSTNATGDSSHSEGDYTIASGYISHAEGNTTKAIGDISHAEGNQTQAISESTHTEGYQTIAGAKAYLADSIVNGLITVNSSYGASVPFDTLIWINDASDDNVFGTIIKTIQSITFNGTNLLIQTNVFDNSIDTNTCKFTPIGFPNESNADESTGISSHSEGDTTIAIGDASHAEGYETIAGGFASHSEGNTTIASGNNSHAGGINSIASGNNSFVHGNGSTASGNGTVVLGDGIDGTADNTTYVNQLNISNVPTGTSINNLGIDANGNVTIAAPVIIPPTVNLFNHYNFI